VVCKCNGEWTLSGCMIVGTLRRRLQSDQESSVSSLIFTHI
jgi:hypothetical protein